MAFLSELKASECTVTRMFCDNEGIAFRVYISHPVFQGQEKIFKRDWVGKKKLYWKCILEHTNNEYGFIIKSDISGTLNGKKK